MQVTFKRSVAIDGKIFVAGVHNLDAATADHWYVKALIKDGAAIMVQEKPQAAPKAEPAPEVEPQPAKPARRAKKA